MKLARIQVDGKAVLARLNEGMLQPLDISGEGDDGSWMHWSSGDFAAAAPVGAPVSPVEAEFLPAVSSPRKIIAVGLNYHEHAVESQREAPKAPLLFAKTENTLAAHGSVIRCPSDLTTNSDFEAELAIVIGRRAVRVSEEDAMGHVFGYSVANDVSARDVQFADGQWMRGKSFDTYCPLGPYLTLADAVPDVMDLRISARLNDETMQDDRTSSMIFGVAHLISYISTYMALETGDVILSGTPAGVGFARDPAIYLRDGDLIEIEIEHLGTLSNTVSSAPAFPSDELAGHAAADRADTVLVGESRSQAQP